MALEAVPNLKHLVDFAIALKSIGVSEICHTS